ncbi:proton-conducting transporter membrane subunit [Pseudonocardia sp. WMMC193]|uniref:NADH-quinone oxidoreductase subunit 5 family protein n=1 Tax=Pseudonocardia sp. WMMC193 TaxID=2911965 RepID=UPI001F3CE55B|nr:proton-conducting transporter membrane subunit [Pseudonocardia sp. WMMC193]MCF7552676.1 NADH-quinone oxidoreductase subunit L [Pseudonocardia sp. WMMC193]
MLLWWMSGVPLLGGVLLVVVGVAARPRPGLAVGAGIGLAAAVLGLGVAAAVTRPTAAAPLLTGMPVGLAVDGLSAVLVVTVGAVLLAVLVFAAGEPDLRTGRFVGTLLVFAGAMLVTVTATTLPPLLMAWEIMGATSWALIGYHHRDSAAVGAARTAFLTTRAADLGLYVAAGALLAGGVEDLALDGTPAGVWLHVAVAGMVLAALGKSAQLPFSFWLSGAMRGPSPVSALLHSATMVAAGAYLLLRITPQLAATGWAGPLVAWVGAATAVLLGLVAAAQSDLKQLLAASTCAQIGYMVLAAGVGGVSGGALQLVAHAATKSLLFLAAGAWLVALGTRELAGLRGAARRFPALGVVFTVGALSLAGVPPLSLWVGKDAVLAAAAHSPALYGAGLAGAVVAAVYSGRALWVVWRRPGPPVGVERKATGRVGLAMVLPAAALAVPAALVGIAALATGRGPGVVELVVSGGLAVLALAVTWAVLEQRDAASDPSGALLGWLGLEQLAHALVVRPTLALARALDRVDGGLDSAVGGLAHGTRLLSGLLDRRGERLIAGSVAAVAAGSQTLARWARRPQTGQLHQYLAQLSVGAAALAALALLVIVVR